MAQFQLYDGNKPVGRRFEDEAGAYDTKACSDLLKRLQIGHKIPTGRALLVSYHNGRKAKEYRA